MRVGVWEEEEHCRFLRGIFCVDPGVVEFGKDWREVRRVIGSRREKQIQSHFQKYVRKVARMVKKIKRKGSSFYYQDPVL
jgi:SHAQKYF class myb-like DNA-binding protein